MSHYSNLVSVATSPFPTINSAGPHRMAQHLMPFGAGTRACPGRNQAQIMFRVTIAALVVNFDLVCDPRETNEETMALRDAFVSGQYGLKCYQIH